MRRFPLAVLLISIPISALAVAVFPDVPDGHRFQAEIEALVHAGIVHGNPDGKFYPDKIVNRAEMLKMLYIAAGRTPDGTKVGCFTDVDRGAWYEIYVCDAASHNFIAGYGDRTFKPGQPVNRVEALKMLFQVLELPAPPVSEADRDVIKFVDISVSAWYTRFIYAAYAEGILPIAGMDSARFEPDRPLTRAEAAAYIHGAVELELAQERQATEQQEEQARSSSSSSSSSAAEEDPKEYVSFPFLDDGQFTEKKTMSYFFTLTDKKTTGQIDASITGAISSNISCRLYKLRDDGFSEQYFLGLEDKGSCVIKVALEPGNYQLQLQPSVGNAYFRVSAAVTTGDGNDGFMEARKLPRNTPIVEVLAPGDLYDWFTFTVPEGGVRGELEATSSMPVGCVIYTPLDVDLFGFSGPQCNEYYDYPAGTYTVGITHHKPYERSQTYTVRIKY